MWPAQAPPSLAVRVIGPAFYSVACLSSLSCSTMTSNEEVLAALKQLPTVETMKQLNDENRSVFMKELSRVEERMQTMCMENDKKVKELTEKLEALSASSARAEKVAQEALLQSAAWQPRARSTSPAPSFGARKRQAGELGGDAAMADDEIFGASPTPPGLSPAMTPRSGFGNNGRDPIDRAERPHVLHLTGFPYEMLQVDLTAFAKKILAGIAGGCVFECKAKNQSTSVSLHFANPIEAKQVYNRSKGVVLTFDDEDVDERIVATLKLFPDQSWTNRKIGTGMFKLYTAIIAIFNEPGRVKFPLYPNKAKRTISVKVGARLVPIVELGTPGNDGVCGLFIPDARKPPPFDGSFYDSLRKNYMEMIDADRAEKIKQTLDAAVVAAENGEVGVVSVKPAGGPGDSVMESSAEDGLMGVDSQETPGGGS